MERRERIMNEIRTLDERLSRLSVRGKLNSEEITEANELIDRVNVLDEELRGIATTSGPQYRAAQSSERGNGSSEESLRGFGTFLQAVAAVQMPPGRKLGDRIETGMIYPHLLRGEQRAGSGLEEATPSLGGYLVGKTYAAELYQRVRQTAVVFPRCRNIPIGENSNGLKMNAIDETSRADGSRWGGTRMYWTEEAELKTGSKPKFRQMELTLKKLTGLCYATDELLQDATALAEVVQTAFGEEYAFKLDDAVINGTGAGQPLGILNAACLISVSKETGQAASTILWDNIKKMWARLWPASRGNAFFLVNSGALPQLMSMSIPVGTSGIPAWVPADAAAGRPNTTLLGRPVLEVEQAQALGTVGDIILADLSQYLTITKGGLQAASSMHVRFVYDEMTFRFVFRVDGQPLWSSALTPFKGSDSQGPFIVLATRS